MSQEKSIAESKVYNFQQVSRLVLKNKHGSYPDNFPMPAKAVRLGKLARIFSK